MGLFDSLIRNVANDVLGDAVRQVERNVSSSISGKVSSVVDDYTDAAKTKVADKKVELRNKIIAEAEKNKPYEILPNSEKSETLRFANKNRVKYHYVDENKGIDMMVPMIAIGAMTYQIAESGKYEGQEDVAYTLSEAAFSALQKALDEVTEKHTAPEEVFDKHAILLTQKTKTYMEEICMQYKIPERTNAFSVIYPADGYVAPAGGSTSSVGGSWTCPYCGSAASGTSCPSCGAARGE